VTEERASQKDRVKGAGRKPEIRSSTARLTVPMAEERRRGLKPHCDVSVRKDSPRLLAGRKGTNPKKTTQTKRRGMERRPVEGSGARQAGT